MRGERKLGRRCANQKEVQRTRPEGPEHELDVEEAYDKPRRDTMT